MQSLLKRPLYKVNILLFCRWDNGETEKLSPWDVEAIPENGTSDYLSFFLNRMHILPFIEGEFKQFCTECSVFVCSCFSKGFIYFKRN